MKSCRQKATSFRDIFSGRSSRVPSRIPHLASEAKRRSRTVEESARVACAGSAVFAKRCLSLSGALLGRTAMVACVAVSMAAAQSSSPQGHAGTAALPPLSTAEPVAQKIFERTAATGMVVVAVRDGDVWMSSYGRVAFDNEARPGPDSLLRLCSLTKILATDLLVKMVADKTVAFTDPLQTFAPGGVAVPAKTIHGSVDRPITLGDLATHTAGLPREIAYPPVGAAHFTFPDYEFRWQWLPTFRLRTVPGEAAHYSNIGFDLLADALSQAAHKPYPELFAERTVRPLGLRDTTLQPNAEQCTRLMNSPREPSMCTTTEAAAGSGGMYSTPRDMARLLRYFLGLPGVPAHQNGYSTAVYLQPADLRSVQGLSHAGVPTGIGLGWIEINRDFDDARIIEKTGGGAGFQTYIALNPAHHAGIFVALTQSRRRSAGNMFREANDLLLGIAGLPPVPVDPDDPERERTADELEEAAKTARPRRVSGRSRHAQPGAVAAGKSAHRPAKARKTPEKANHRR